MKVLELNKPISIEAVVRFAPTTGDSLSLILRNEFTNLSLNLPLTWSIVKDRLVFSFDMNADFNSGNKYQMEIKNNTQTIYFGKLIIVKENTNIQNYTPSNQRPQRFKSKV